MKAYKSILRYIFSIIFLIVIFLIYTACQTNNDMDVTHNHNDLDKSHMNHSSIETLNHNMSVKIKITKDMMSGINIKLETKDFVFAPENVNKENIDGEGHAHLYIDGVKWGRLYGKHVHIGNLSEGNHVFKVTLNANNHDNYSHHNMLIEDEVSYDYKK